MQMDQCIIFRQFACDHFYFNSNQMFNLHSGVYWSCNSCSDKCSTGANKIGHNKSYKAHNEDAEAALQVV